MWEKIYLEEALICPLTLSLALRDVCYSKKSTFGSLEKMV